jgi:hypothetical protein
MSFKLSELSGAFRSSKPADVTLTICIPHLFDSLSEWNTNFSFVPETDVLVPFLSQFFVKKNVLAGFIPSLYEIVDFDGQQKSFPPHAVYCYNYDFDELPTDAVLLATPIHLQTGMADVTVDGLAVTDISSVEAKLLQTLVNKHFQQDNLRLEISASGRWYVLLPFELMPETTYPADNVLGNSLFPFLHHTQQLEWNRLLNELQMLLYSAAVNQQRESKGLRSVSSFWLWGNSQYSAQCTIDKGLNLTESVRHVVAGGFHGKAFSHALQAKWHKHLPKTINGDTVVIIDNLLEPSLCNDIDQWQYELTRIETDYIRPLMKLYQTNNNNIELIINTCDGRQWHKNHWYQRLFSRKKHSLVDYVI